MFTARKNEESNAKAQKGARGAKDKKEKSTSLYSFASLRLCAFALKQLCEHIDNEGL